MVRVRAAVVADARSGAHLRGSCNTRQLADVALLMRH
jgi:hypothetical protein